MIRKVFLITLSLFLLLSLSLLIYLTNFNNNKKYLNKKTKANVPKIHNSPYFSQVPSSYIIWWPGMSSDRNEQSINYEWNRMINFYHPEYIILLLGWYDIQKEFNRYDFTMLNLILNKAKENNLKVIIQFSLDAYGGIGIYPYTYASLESWFWKRSYYDSQGKLFTFGHSDPLSNAMRHPPTCGCSCNPNPFYNKDFSVLKGPLNSDHRSLTCNGFEEIPIKKRPDGSWETKVIYVNEHPDLVYSTFDTFWPGDTLPNSKNLTIHTPYPSFSSADYQNAVKEVWRALVTHIKNNYSQIVKGYSIWHEPTYAGFREGTFFTSKNQRVEYEVDYSVPELNNYNKWLSKKALPTVSQIPFPPDKNYIHFRKENLAQFMKMIKNHIKTYDPLIPAGIQLMIVGNQEKADKEAIDPEIMMRILEPDFIAEYAVFGTPSGGLETDSYGDGQTLRQKLEIIKRINTNKVPLIAGTTDIFQEIKLYNVTLFSAVKPIYQPNPNVPGGLIPLLPHWLGQNLENVWKTKNQLQDEKSLAGAYDSPYYYEVLKNVDIPRTLKTKSTLEVKIPIVNKSNRNWTTFNTQNPINLGSWWFYPDGTEVKDDKGNPLNTRAYLPLKQFIRPGEQYLFTIPIKTPSKSGNYQIKIDMVEEGKTWFFWQGINPINLLVTVEESTPTPTPTKNPTPTQTRINPSIVITPKSLTPTLIKLTPLVLPIKESTPTPIKTPTPSPIQTTLIPTITMTPKLLTPTLIKLTQ